LDRRYGRGIVLVSFFGAWAWLIVVSAIRFYTVQPLPKNPILWNKAGNFDQVNRTLEASAAGSNNTAAPGQDNWIYVDPLPWRYVDPLPARTADIDVSDDIRVHKYLNKQLSKLDDLADDRPDLIIEYGLPALDDIDKVIKMKVTDPAFRDAFDQVNSDMEAIADAKERSLI
jgi:hypothetical protein